MAPYLSGNTSMDNSDHSEVQRKEGSEGKKIKCVLVGDGSIGKTSMIVSYTTNGYPTEYTPTAFDKYTAEVSVDGTPINLQLCDTAGQDDFERLRKMCYPNTDVFLLCYSVISPTSYHNVREKWLPELRLYAHRTPIVLVGTQTDLRDDVRVKVELHKYNEKPVAQSEGAQLAREIGAITYIECSSLTKSRLKEVFDIAILTALEKRNNRQSIISKKPKKHRGLRSLFSCFAQSIKIPF